MNVRIQRRAVEPQDRDFLREVFGSTRESELANADFNEQQREVFLDMQFHIQDTHYHNVYPHASYEVIEVNGRPAGRLYVDRGREDIRVVDIALLPAYCGKGIGSNLLSALLEEGRQSACTVSIHVEHNNPALRLYKRLGFKKKDDTGVYFLMEWRTPPMPFTTPCNVVGEDSQD